MRILPRLALAVAAATFLIAQALVAQTRHAPVRAVTHAEFDGLMKELSNWGRWGKADERGTLNLITPASRLAASKLVRDGVAVSMSREADKEKAVDNTRPYIHQVLTSSEKPGADIFSDQITVAPHGVAHTHMDALCHFSYNGQSYNGFPISNVTATGAKHLNITIAENGIYARGVLVDIPLMKGLPYLEPDTAIYPEDLDAWEKFANVKIRQGDVLLVRSGRWARRAEKGPWNMADRAGLHASSMRWIHKRDIAILGGDAAQDLHPSGVEGVDQPVHVLSIVAMGTPIFDNVNLEDVAKECAKRRRWEFLVTAAPLRVPDATGTAMNPIAIF
jgi:kynurenine formamidase